MKQVGDKAPDFTLQRENGEQVTLQSYQGKYVVLYFYPKDNTPGCSIQSRQFSQHYDLFVKAGIAVFGISKDSVASHQRFCEKQQLTIPLLSDIDGKVCEAFGVWQEKKLFGKIGMGIARTTFIISPSGQIEQVFIKANTKTNAQEVAEYFKLV